MPPSSSRRHLKAIFPFDPRGAYGTLGSFREEYHGGVLHLFRYLLSINLVAHQNKGQPGELPPEREALWREAMANPDFKIYPHVYNILTQKGQHLPAIFDLLIHPYDREEIVEKAEADFKKINIPAYTGSGWYAYGYKTHLNGAQNWFRNINFAEEARLRRPLASRAALPFLPSRNSALVRSLAEEASTPASWTSRR